MRPAQAQRGFTLLEVMIALAILAISLVALSDINAGAIAMHSYAKKLTVATFLAKNKMLDIESQLDSEGLPVEGDNISPSDGKFDEQGFPDFTWKVEVIAPKADALDPTKLINMVMGGGADGTSPSASDPSSAGGGLLGMLMGGGSSPSGSTPSSSAAPSNPTSSASGLGAGMASSMMAAPAQMMISQITQMVREIHLTITWMDGKNPQEFTVIEHLVSMGPNTPVNGTSNSGTKNTGGLPTTTPGTTVPTIPGVTE